MSTESLHEAVLTPMIKGQCYTHANKLRRKLSDSKKKSRKAWAETALKVLKQAASVIKIEHDRKKKVIRALLIEPDDEQFSIVPVVMDYKRFVVEVFDSYMGLTTHFIVRVLQYLKTSDVQSLGPFLDGILHFAYHPINEIKRDNIISGSCDCYIGGTGFIPFVIEQSVLIPKTFIPIDAMTPGKHTTILADIPDGYSIYNIIR